MSQPTEKSAPEGRQNVPIAHALQPMRDAFSALSEAQRQSEQALQQALTGIDLLLSAVGVPEPEAAPPSPVAPPSAEAIPASPSPQPESPAPRSDQHLAPQPSLRPVDPAPEPRTAAPTAAAEPPSGGDADDADPRRLVRARLLDVHRAMLEINRLPDPEAILKRIWALARERDLRCMILQSKARALQAEAAEGFPSLDGASVNRIRKVQVPFDKDGVFAAVADERTIYSGPRPARGLPVDLILVLGKKKPVWCLVIPFPCRNRWARFLYIETDVTGMEAMFQIDAIARFAVMQMHAARFHRHTAADKTRAIKAFTLSERQRRRKPEVAAPPPPPADPEEPEESPEDADLMSLLANKGRREAPAPPPPAERPPLLLTDTATAEPADEEQRLAPEDILARIGDLPAMPHVALRVLSMLNDPDATVASIQEAISSDQALSVRLLQIANSSLYGTMRDCSTISEAVMRLGFKSIRSWLLATATRTAFLDGSSNQADLEVLWKESVIAAMAAQLLAEQHGEMDPEVAFMGGLLQNIGLLLLARDHPAVYSEVTHRSRQERVPTHQIEREMVGFDHADLSALILQHWGLADSLVAAVGSHHRLETSGSSRVFAAIIDLGETLAMAATDHAAYIDVKLDEEDAARALHLGALQLTDIRERLESMMMDRRLLP